MEETITFYKETLVESAAQYRAQQLKELEVLARAIAILTQSPEYHENEKLTKLWTVLSSKETASTLNEKIETLSVALKSFAEDNKLQKLLAKFVE